MIFYSFTLIFSFRIIYLLFIIFQLIFYFTQLVLYIIQIEQQQQEQLSISLPNLKTIEIPEYKNDQIVPPSTNKNRQRSWQQVDTSKFKYRRQSLQPEYELGYQIYQNRYNKARRQTIEVPQQNKKQLAYQQPNDIFRAENQKPRYQRSKSPDIFQKTSSWELRKFNKRIDNDQIKNQTGEYQYNSARKKAPDFVRTSLTDSLVDLNKDVPQQNNQQVLHKSRKYVPKDNKELFMPFDEQYGLPECRGWTKGYSKPSSSKIQNRSGAEVDQMIQDYKNQEGFGIASGLQLQSVD